LFILFDKLLKDSKKIQKVGNKFKKQNKLEKPTINTKVKSNCSKKKYSVFNRLDFKKSKEFQIKKGNKKSPEK